MLYTVAAGVDPDVCLPICLDVGTNNGRLLEDPSYKGLRQRRPGYREYNAFMAEFVQALQAWQPHVVLQFEDFHNSNAFRCAAQRMLLHGFTALTFLGQSRCPIDELLGMARSAMQDHDVGHC